MEKNLQSPSSSPHLTSILIRACAGGGKTTQLIHQLLEVAESYHLKKETWPSVIVTTFTNKATEELKERILKRSTYEKEHLLDFVTSRKNLHISTLHGVLILFLKRFGNHLFLNQEKSEHFNLSFDFNIANSLDRHIRLKSLLKDCLFEEKESELLMKEFGFERLFQMLINWNKAFLENPKIKAHDSISFLDLYKKRITQWVDSLKTFTKNLDKNQKEEIFLKTLLNQLNLLKESSKDEIIIEILNFIKQKSNLKTLKEAEKEWVLKFLKDLSVVLKKESFSKKQWEKYFYFFQLFENLAKKFHLKLMTYKEENNSWNIEDLELLSWKLIRENPGLALNFSQEWDYWLIDEYQDISPLQDKILKSLIQKRPSFIVGDVHQSIYFFRGASKEVLEKKEDEFFKKGAKILIKNKNFRACPELLYFLNDFFSRLKLSFIFKKMEPREKHFSSKKKVCYFSMIDGIKKGEPPPNSSDINALKEEEYFSILSHIQNLKNRGENYKDICILGRTNLVISNLSSFLKKNKIPYTLYGSSNFNERREILDAKALFKFLLNPHDNYNLIQLLRSPFFYIPDPDISNQVFDVKGSFWNHWIKNKKYLLKEKKFDPFLRLESHLKDLKEKSLLEVYKKALWESRFIEMLSSHDPTGQAEANLWKWVIGLSREEKKKNFKPLEYLMEGPKHSNNPLNENFDSKDFDLQEGLSNLKFFEKEMMSPITSDSVHLMTIHASKGLSFKHVLLASLHLKETTSSLAQLQFSLNQKLRWSFPISFENKPSRQPSLADEEFLNFQRKKEKEESDRLLYVALTRAEQSLFLSWIESDPLNPWVSKIKQSWNLEKGEHSMDKYSYSCV